MKINKEKFIQILREEMSSMITDGKLRVYAYLEKSNRLKKTVTDLLGTQYLSFIKDLYVSAPMPTTFVMTMVNDAKINLIYDGQTFIGKVAGKRYRLDNASDLTRCRERLSDILTMSYPNYVKNEDVTAIDGTEDTDGIVTTNDVGADEPVDSSTSLFKSK
jgi:hypothetical protein